MNYKGEACAHCGKTFTDDDDVVVCPICGTPHHRECYKINNSCANAGFHSENKKWKHKADIPEPIENDPSTAFDEAAPLGGNDAEDPDARSGGNGSEYDRFGGNGAAMPFDPTAVITYYGFDPKEDLGGATMEEAAMFVRSNTFYYLPLFKKMKQFGSKISFNVSCLFFPSLYFANRKMWGWAIITGLLTAILGLPDVLLTFERYFENVEGYEQVLNIIYEHKSVITEWSSITGAASWIMSIVMCLFGNLLYYKYVMRSISKIKRTSENDETVRLKMEYVGGIKPVNVLKIVILMSVVSLGLIYLVMSAMA